MKKFPNKYIVCTQNKGVRTKLSFIPGVPIVHYVNNVLMMSDVSQASKDVVTGVLWCVLLIVRRI